MSAFRMVRLLHSFSKRTHDVDLLISVCNTCCDKDPNSTLDNGSIGFPIGPSEARRLLLCKC